MMYRVAWPSVKFAIGVDASMPVEARCGMNSSVWGAHAADGIVSHVSATVVISEVILMPYPPANKG